MVILSSAVKGNSSPFSVDSDSEKSAHDASVPSYRILLINGSQEEACGIAPWLREKVPGAEVLFVPSIELAFWLLDRNHYDMVVSSELLPDGSFERLVRKLEAMRMPPSLLVIGTADQRRAMDSASVYQLASLAPVVDSAMEGADPMLQEVLEQAREIHFNSSISHLGADIRNDLNNPLQEIVAMAFVARSMVSGKEQVDERTEQALRAINDAARGMADVVNNLEQKIRHTVQAHIHKEY